MTKCLVLLAFAAACGGSKSTANHSNAGSAATPTPTTDTAKATSFASVADLAKAFDADPSLETKTVDVKAKLGVLTQQTVGGAVYWDVALTDDPTKPGGGVWCRIKDADKDAAKAATAGVTAKGKLGRVKKGDHSSPMLDDCAITAAP